MSTDPIGTRPPSKVFQADRIHYRIQTEFAASDGWGLKVAFVTHDVTGVSGDLQTILTVADAISEVSGSPGLWDVDLDSSGASSPSTQAWQVGLYHWQEYVEKAAAAERHTLREGTMLVRQSFGSGALGSGGDFRTWARISLENVEAVLQSKATKDQLSYSIAGRSLQRYTPKELMEFRSELRAIVDREDALEAIANDGYEDAGSYLVEF